TGPSVELDIVLRAVPAVTVAATGQNVYGDAAQPLIHFDIVRDLGCEIRAGQFHRFADRDEMTVVVTILIVLDEKIPAVAFLVVAEIADSCAHGGIGRGHFVAFGRSEE